MRQAAVALLLFLGAGCSRCDAPAPTSTATTDASQPISSAKPAVVEASIAKSEDAAAAAPKTETEIGKDAKPPISGEMDQPIVRRKTDKGNLVVWAQDDGEMSLVLAGYESKPGELAAPAKILRRTSGKVAAIDVLATGSDDISVAWASSLGESKGGQLIALVFASVDLARVTTPTTLGIVAAPIALQGHVGLAKNPKGGVIVAHQGPTAKCVFINQPSECASFDVKAVSSVGRVDRLGGSKVDGGPSPEYFFVDLDGRGLAVYASSMRGGRTIESVIVPYVVGETPPAIALPVCSGIAGITPEFQRGTKGEIVALCMNTRPEKGACAKPTRDDPNRCPSVAVTGSDGKLITPKTKDVDVLRVECADGKHKIMTTSAGEITLAAPSTILADFTKGPCGS